MKQRLCCYFLILSALYSVNAGDFTFAPYYKEFTSNSQRYAATDGNPALLGAEQYFQSGMYLPGLNLSTSVWSDKLAINPFNGYVFDSLQDCSRLFSKILRNSFDLDGLSDTAVSDKLTDEFKGGVKLYTGLRASIANAAIRRFSFDITTRFDEELHLPEAPFLILFSRDKGLVRGSTLDFSDFRQEAVWATDFTFHYGLPFSIPALSRFFNYRYSSLGAGIKYVMGHSILQAQTEEGTVKYNTDSNAIEVKSRIHVRTAGFGLHGNWKADQFRTSVAGHGIGLDLGGILYDEHGSFSVNMQNLGALFWVNDQHDVTYSIRKNNFRIYDLVKAIDDADKNGSDAAFTIFNRKNNEYLPDESDSLKKCGSFTTSLPASLVIGYSRVWNFTLLNKKWLSFVSESASSSVEYRQALSRGPGQSFVPQFILSGENISLRGYLPLRLSFSAGGPEKSASAAGFGINTKRFELSVSYKAFGNMVFIPKRGMELSVNAALSWGGPKDKDSDGIDNRLDKCRKIAEDIDNFEDDDGCPDFDNDNDKIPDTLDKCIEVAEDHDGFSDSDGCPDYDNDLDSIPDTLDKCITSAEDCDGFEDTDGCPDSDNDLDSIPDSLDKCISLAEDYDGYEDDDGCPDIDSDRDSVPDSIDNCISVPEDRDWFEDSDGCPDYDNDSDSIPDTLDNCMWAAEDCNGIEDADGCPDSLNSHDSFPFTSDTLKVAQDSSVNTSDTGACKDTVSSPSCGEMNGNNNSAAVKPDSAAVKPDSAAVKPDSAAVKPDSAVVKPDSAVVKPDSAVVKPDSAVVKPDSLSSTGVLLLNTDKAAVAQEMEKTESIEKSQNSLQINDTPASILKIDCFMSIINSTGVPESIK